MNTGWDFFLLNFHYTRAATTVASQPCFFFNIRLLDDKASLVLTLFWSREKNACKSSCVFFYSFAYIFGKQKYIHSHKQTNLTKLNIHTYAFFIFFIYSSFCLSFFYDFCRRLLCDCRFLIIWSWFRLSLTEWRAKKRGIFFLYISSCLPFYLRLN